jgi:hypothetical protein
MEDVARHGTKRNTQTYITKIVAGVVVPEND